MNFITQHRVRIPNSLAIIAAVMLLGSSVADFSGKQDGYTSAPDDRPKAEAGKQGNDVIDNSAKHHRRGLNLGLLLFRHG